MASTFKEYNIAYVPGDGGGKDTTQEAIKVMNNIADVYGFKLNFNNYPHGGDHYLATGETLSDSTVSEWRDHDAIFLGAVGHPDVKPGVLEKGILLKTRFDLDQYINLRPSVLFPNVDAPIRRVHPNIPDGFRIDVVRENCGGLYKGIGGKRKNKKGEIEYFQEMNYTPREMRRILEWAFDYTKKRSDREGIDRKLTFAHKGNVVTHVFDPMREIYKELQAANPYVKSDDGYINAGCGPWLLGNPQGLDVLVTTNMFGDIITDEQAEWFGGMGGAGSTNKNPNGISLYEPVHGSAPQFAGKNVLSPIAAMMSGVMMLADLGERAAADRIYKGIWNSFKNKKITNTTVNSGVPTDQQTKFVLEEMARVV